ncbi:ras GTPase-activating protein nGAP isoform X2 [Hydra vulgaris]|uniref:Ras GTPase-activating protein nGAP isoform X2 n=1 Tax=Hydra vulgaris TaxID=6087 RepID=A0ABM4BCS4_HYDVU
MEVFPLDKKLSGWLSVVDANENIRKLYPENIIWKLKAVCFEPSTKYLYISSISSAEEQEISLDSPLKSPGGSDVLSPRSENYSPRSSSTFRPRLESQPSNSSFKQFISRKLALSRSRSVGKVGIQRTNESSSPKSSSVLLSSWKSAESDYYLDDDRQVTVMCLNDPALSIVRPIHDSVLLRPFCFQVITPTDTKYFSCSSHEECSSWIKSMTSVIQINRDENVRLDTSLSVWVIEAKGIPIRKRYYCELLLNKVLFCRTSVKCMNEMLFWGEQFSFNDLPPTESVTINLFRESDTKKKRKPDKSVFIGSSVIDLLNVETNIEIEKWVSVFMPGISPKTQQKNSVNSKIEQPFIRIKFTYGATVVLPISYYKKLHDFLRTDYMVLTNTLEKVISLKTKDILAQTLLKILHASGEAHAFLVDVIMNEVKNTPNENLMFRGNSLATKSIDTYMKMVGRMYLQETLGTFISSVYESEEDAEVDPQKITPLSSAVLSGNQRNLIKLVEDVWKNIMLSVNFFPISLQKVFSTVRERCQSMELNISKKIVSASLFLRFLCPAILSPSLFQLISEYPSEKVARTLTLIAKTIQNLANFTRFGSKECYMKILNDFVESEISNMDLFLQNISNEPKSDDSSDTYTFCGQIDLARELSVTYHLLVAEISKTNEDNNEKYNELKTILEDITKAHKSFPNAEELRLHRPFETVASVCGQPLSAPGLHGFTSHDYHNRSNYNVIESNENLCSDNSPLLANMERKSNINDKLCYDDDTNFSFTEDYVSDSSFVSQSYLPNSELLKNERSNNWSNPSAEINCESNEKFASVSKKVVSHISESKRMFDKIEDDSQNHKRNERNSYKNPKLVNDSYLKTKKKEGSVKDRINLFSQDTRKFGEISRVPGKEKDSHESPNNDGFTNKLKGGNLSSKKHVACSSEFKTNDQNSLKTSSFTFSKSPLATRKKVEQKEPFDRSKLVLQNLKSEHKFSDAKSSVDPNLEKSPTSSVDSMRSSNSDSRLSISRGSRVSNFSGGSRLSSISESGRGSVETVVSGGHLTSENSANKRYLPTTQPPAEPLNISRKHNKQTDLNRYEPQNDIFYSSDTLNFAKEEQREKVLRRYSQMAPNEVKREIDRNNFNRDTMIVAQSREIAQIHSNGFCEILHEGIIEKSCSLTSIYSSSYSSCSCSSVETSSSLEGILVEGDNLEDTLLENEAESSGKGPGADRRVSAVGMSLPRKASPGQVERYNKSVTDQTELLQHKLKEKDSLIQKLQIELKNKSKNFEQTVLHLREKLIHTNEKMKIQRQETDNEMKTVINRLMVMENKLRNDQTEMEDIIKSKDRYIDFQERRISTLEETNSKLIKALTSIKKRYNVDESHGSLSNHFEQLHEDNES